MDILCKSDKKYYTCVSNGTGGSSGTTLYTWIRYAATTDGADPMTDKIVDSTVYIGIAYNKAEAPSSSAKDYNDKSTYTWGRLIGQQGLPGTTYYTWIRYAPTNDTSKADMTSVMDENSVYIGIASNKEENDSCDEAKTKSNYTWGRILGKEGTPGAPGTPGSSLYTWIKYADDAIGTGISDEPAGKKYVGIAYNQTSAQEGTDASKYTWSLIRGNDGVTYYTWVKYADDVDGTGMSDEPNGKKYMGVATNKTSPDESTVPTDYKWSLIQGEAGAAGDDAVLYSIEASCDSIIRNLTNIAPDKITFTGYKTVGANKSKLSGYLRIYKDSISTENELSGETGSFIEMSLSNYGYSGDNKNIKQLVAVFSNAAKTQTYATLTVPFTIGSDLLELAQVEEGKVVIAEGKVTASSIVAGAITAGKIDAGAVTADKIKANTITANEIAANTITANEIAAGTITSNLLATDAVSSRTKYVAAKDKIFAESGSLIDMSGEGSIHFKNFAVDSNGNTYMTNVYLLKKDVAPDKATADDYACQDLSKYPLWAIWPAYQGRVIELDDNHIKVGSTSVNFIEAGWKTALDYIKLPPAGNSNEFSIIIPDTTAKTEKTLKFEMTKGDPSKKKGSAAVKLSSDVIASIDISDWYAQGENDGFSSVKCSNIDIDSKVNVESKKVTGCATVYLNNDGEEEKTFEVDVSSIYDEGARSGFDAAKLSFTVSYNSTTGMATVVTSYDGTEVNSSQVAVSSVAYNEGWKAAYQDSSSTRSLNAVTVKLPTETPGTFTTTTYKASPYIQDTHKISFPTSISITPGMTVPSGTAAGNYVYKNSVTLEGNAYAGINWTVS